MGDDEYFILHESKILNFSNLISFHDNIRYPNGCLFVLPSNMKGIIIHKKRETNLLWPMDLSLSVKTKYHLDYAMELVLLLCYM